jgi:hypothetical protein
MEGMECAGGAAPCAYWDNPPPRYVAYRSGIGPDYVVARAIANGITVLAWETGQCRRDLRGENAPGGLLESDDVAGWPPRHAALLRRGRAAVFPDLQSG